MFNTKDSQCRFQSLASGVRNSLLHSNNSFSSGFLVGKYEKMPVSCNGIRSNEAGNDIEWFSSVGSSQWIFRTLLTAMLPSLVTNGEIKLLDSQGMYEQLRCMFWRYMGTHRSLLHQLLLCLRLSQGLNQKVSYCRFDQLTQR